MGKKTDIEWTDHSFAPWIGCTKVSPACDNCYAEAMMDKRFHKAKWGPENPRTRTSPENWMAPLRWNAAAQRVGKPALVFCNPQGDVFDNEVPLEWRADLFKVIAETPWLIWLLLTKRVGNAMDMIHEVADMQRLGSHAGHLMAHQWRKGHAPRNVWAGSTVVNQAEADRDIRKLLNLPAEGRFLSLEPLLGPIDMAEIPVSGGGHHAFDPIITVNVLRRSSIESPRIDWVIVGGESGPSARAVHPGWVRSIRDQCVAAKVPFMFKQWGRWAPNCLCDTKHPHRTTPRPEPGSPGVMFQCGKKASGRLLDERLWDERPKLHRVYLLRMSGSWWRDGRRHDGGRLDDQPFVAS